MTGESMTPWICPNTQEFSLLNDPDTFQYGKSFKLVIDYCDQKNESCISDDQSRAEFLKKVTLQSKIVSQYFSPSYYKEHQKLTYTSSERMNSGLVKGVSVIKLYDVN